MGPNTYFSIPLYDTISGIKFFAGSYGYAEGSYTHSADAAQGEVKFWVDDVYFRGVGVEEGPAEIEREFSVIPSLFVSKAIIYCPHPGKLEIFDLSGRLVYASSVNKGKITWVGENAQGKSLSSGIYFAKLVHPKKDTPTLKFVLFKP